MQFRFYANEAIDLSQFSLITKCIDHAQSGLIYMLRFHNAEGGGSVDISFKDEASRDAEYNLLGRALDVTRGY